MVNQTQTLDAEYSVIGALLLQPQIAGELFAGTGEADFVRDELRSVYIAARDIWTAGRQLDPVTIRAAIGKAYEPLLMACMDTCSSWRMWRDYVAAMQVHWKRNPTTCRLCLGGTFLSVKRLNYRQR